MKRSLLIGSILCVVLGVIGIFCGIFQTPAAPTIVILLLLYFIGIPIQFSKCLPESDARKLADGSMYATYDRRFWMRICLGFLTSVLAATIIYKKSYLPLGPSILVGLGLTAILTAFVSPNVEMLKDPDTFG